MNNMPMSIHNSFLLWKLELVRTAKPVQKAFFFFLFAFLESYS